MATKKSNKKVVSEQAEVLVEKPTIQDNPVEEPVQDRKSEGFVEKSGNLDNSGKKSGKISASALPPIPARIQRISGGPRTGKFAVIVGRETLTVLSRTDAWNYACNYNESKGLPKECRMSL